MASSQAASAIASGNLLDLVSSSPSATIYPPLETVLQVLQSRFRADLVYTTIGTRELVVINPWKVLANVNDASRRTYYQRTFLPSSTLSSTDPPPTPSAISKDLQPHIYSFASHVLLALSRHQHDQVVIPRGVTGSGKSHAIALFTSQLAFISLENGGPQARSAKAKSLHKQINAIPTILNAFTQRKSSANPTASCSSTLLELHWSKDTLHPSMLGAKLVMFGLGKGPVNAPLKREERSYNVFYQFLEGATTAERDLYGLEDPSSYALLASSGTYHLPSTQGPWTSEAHGMSELRSALKTLGFKSKHLSSLFSLLVSILNLSNVTFVPPISPASSAEVSHQSRPALNMACRLLGVDEEDLITCLTNRTGYVRREVVNVLLDEKEATKQRDGFVRDLWALCVMWVFESINSRLAPPSEDGTRLLSILDIPGPTIPPHGGDRRSSQMQPLLSFGTTPGSLGTIGGLDELMMNFGNEVLFERIRAADDGWRGGLVQDGVLETGAEGMDMDEAVGEGMRILVGGNGLHAIATNMTTGLLGSLSKAAVSFKKSPSLPSSGNSSYYDELERKEEDFVSDLVAKFGGVRAFEVPLATGGEAGREERRRFVIKHFGGVTPQTYTTASLFSTDADILDPGFVQLGRGSTEPFVKKLFGGPALGMEGHGRDEGVVVRSQVRSVPLRLPTRRSSTDDDEGEDEELPMAKTHPITTQMRWSWGVIGRALERSMRTGPPWVLTCLAPNLSQSTNSFGKGVVKSQLHLHQVGHTLKTHHITPWAMEFGKEDFVERYVPRIQGTWEERFRQWERRDGWRESVDFKVGHRSVWLTYQTWRSVEDLVRVKERELEGGDGGEVGLHSRYDLIDNRNSDDEGDTEDLVPAHLRTGIGGYWEGDRDDEGSVFRDPSSGGHDRRYDDAVDTDVPPSPYVAAQNGRGGVDRSMGDGAASMKDVDNMQVSAAVEKVATSTSRRWWLRLVWLCTWWVPDFLMRYLGRMKRPDIRLAWREKVTICVIIAMINGLILFYIIVFGKLLCPNFDKAWTTEELNQHQGDNDWWAAVQGNVYDLSNFIHRQHSDSNTGDSNTPDVLDPLAGQDLTYYFPVPLSLGCRDLVTDSTLQLQIKNFTPIVPQAIHKSGNLATDPSSRLHDPDWYTARFLPELNDYKKGPLVWDPKKLKEWAQDDQIEKYWAVYETKVFDLTDYFNTIDNNKNVDNYRFLNEQIANTIQGRSGQDVTDVLNKVLDGLDPLERDQNLFCLDNVFRIGLIDFRFGTRCQVQNYLLIIASAILMASIGLKFLAALQLSPKRSPELQDKFVICQVPCYTEGEDSLRRTIDSLSALDYDDKRKLIFIICDGNIIGSGNDRTTPRIVLDILGVDPKIDPEPLLFKSIGEGSKALNYGKVYSGLYEFEGHVVPYMVVVKVGKPTERSKPGNRGKRDSQILLMHYLNRVHFDAPMNPLELEIYHQMRNVIGIDPAFYEYIFTVDADTSVTPESLNRLIASCSDDARIIGICGETKLDNEEGSWWTMIQVYEYYISHHLNKAFESLFGSVTCLPGCFSVYRIRTADKGRPIIISNRIIDEYAEPNVDTLHKKNLFSLGEDRFLTTLMMKHFPTFKTKFNPEAIAHTIAPESFKILFSQRRRWINSTVHNLCELVLLPELFGFCCFSMRFFVFLDLLGTIMLPATVVYLAYLIIVVALGKQTLPQIALIMIAITYGLQALIFIIKREFMLVGWMVVYLLSYPVYSFFLPVYSFWCMDEFSWGNTRLVVGEGKEKKVIMNEEEKFDESMIPLKKFSEYEAEAWETGTRRSDDTGYLDSKGYNGGDRQPRSRGESPHTYQQASQSGDYYRDTNALSKPGSIRSHSNQSHVSQHPPTSQFGAPQIPFMPFGSGPGSVHGSDYGGTHMIPPIGFQNTGSMYAMGMMGPPSAPFMNQMNTGSFGGSQSGGMGMMQPPPAIGSQARPISTFSMATTVNPFSGPSQNPNPTDDELSKALRNYLSTQDLMTVTKKTTREAIAARFPKADLTARKDFLNQSIDSILSES